MPKAFRFGAGKGMFFFAGRGWKADFFLIWHKRTLNWCVVVVFSLVMYLLFFTKPSLLD